MLCHPGAALKRDVKSLIRKVFSTPVIIHAVSSVGKSAVCMSDLLRLHFAINDGRSPAIRARYRFHEFNGEPELPFGVQVGPEGPRP